MKLSAIVGMGRNNIIGKDNSIPWHLSADLKYFKKITTGHHIIMGRKNYESIGKPLPNRTNIIITRQKYFEAEGCIIVNSISKAIEIAKKNDDDEAFIIGGGHIYKQTIDLVDKLYVTYIDIDVEGDVFFPDIDKDQWEIVFEEKHIANSKDMYDYKFVVYNRVR